MYVCMFARVCGEREKKKRRVCKNVCVRARVCGERQIKYCSMTPLDHIVLHPSGMACQAFGHSQLIRYLFVCWVDGWFIYLCIKKHNMWFIISFHFHSSR